MMGQTEWGFKVESTSAKITPLAGVVLVDRIAQALGVRASLLILPVIALGGYALAAFYPVLGIIRWVKTAENATDYSLQNTLRGVLFLPTTREMKYKAKQAIDTIFVRAGDVLSALLVFLGTTYLAFETEHFALVNLGLVTVWVVFAVLIGRRFRELTPGSGLQFLQQLLEFFHAVGVPGKNHEQLPQGQTVQRVFLQDLTEQLLGLGQQVLVGLVAA